MPARFHIPDFTRNFHLNKVLLALLREYPEYFRDGVEIASVYGEFPSSIWNGGRCLSGRTNKDAIKECIRAFNDEGVAIRYTYTNPLITKKYLDDEHCNRCMALAHNGKNGVIVVSEELEHYIRKNYPNYKITSSTCKGITEMDDLKAELEKDYDMVVLDYNWNNRFEELAQIPHKEKCELLINAVCMPACPRRKEHYLSLGKTQIAYCQHMQHHPEAPFVDPEDFHCTNPQRILYDTTQFATHITPDDIFEKYVPMGFQNFKIEGRSSNMFNNMETYLYYMAKPEHRDRLRLIYLLSLEQNKALITMQ